MPVCETCGHDATAIQQKMEQRIAEQGARIKETTAMLAAEKNRATELEGRVKEFSAREEAITIREAESAGGWSLDDRGRKLARWAYEDSTEGVDAAERPSFADWLKGEQATNDPILASYRNPVAPAAKGQPVPPTGPRPPTPPQNGSTSPPTRKTLDQINAEVRQVMSSGIPAAEKSAKLSELKAQRDQASKAPAA